MNGRDEADARAFDFPQRALDDLEGFGSGGNGLMRNKEVVRI